MILVLFVISNKIYYSYENKVVIKIFNNDINNGIPSENVINQILDELIINKKKTIIKIICNTKKRLDINYVYMHYYIGDLLNQEINYININKKEINNYYHNELITINNDYYSLYKDNTKNIIFGDHPDILMIYQQYNKIHPIYLEKNYIKKMIKNLLN